MASIRSCGENLGQSTPSKQGEIHHDKQKKHPQSPRRKRRDRTSHRDHLGNRARVGKRPKCLAPKILALFDALPGDKAVSILAPATNGKPQLTVAMNADKQLFVGSAIKTFVLAEALRQADSPAVVATLKAKQLTLDASVWNLDSATFNPPNSSARSPREPRSKQ